MKLDPRATAAGVRLATHDVLGSTNAEALERARRGERGPLWITAARQTAGRGRRGRRWVSEPGNLYATLLLTSSGPVGHWPQLSFVAALAAHDAIAAVAAGVERRLAIKWPNDVLLDGAKLAGVLLEGQGAFGGEAAAVAIGIGVNCTSHPLDTEQAATDLVASGVSAERLFVALSGAMTVRLAQWDHGHAFAAIRADWLARAAGLGAELKLRLPEREMIGRFAGIDANGGLLLRRSDGTITTVAAGDVFLSAGGATAAAS